MLTDQQRKRVFNTIIATQCLGMLSTAFFQNGFFLNYFTKLGISSASIAFLIGTLPPLVGGLLILPFAFVADRKGKMKLAMVGQVLIVAGLLATLAAGWVKPPFALPTVVVSIAVFSVGGSLQASGWFALLNPIIPREIRGRFFGRLRVSFQTVTIIFSTLITKALGLSNAMWVFQSIIAVVFVAHILRFFTYSRIPELEKEHHETDGRLSFKDSLAYVFRIKGYLQFVGYIFLVTLFTAGTPVVFALMQKDVFGFAPAQITLMGTLFLVGSVAGNFLGGRLVDRLGTRLVFLTTHTCLAAIIVLMLARHWMPWPLVVHVGICSLLFSLAGATTGIAITSEMLALIPSANRSLSTAVGQVLFNLGMSLSCAFVSFSISWKPHAHGWQLLGRGFTQYDSILLAYASLTILLLATVGLVPKIVKKAQLMPGSGYPRI